MIPASTRIPPMRILRILPLLCCVSLAPAAISLAAPAPSETVKKDAPENGVDQAEAFHLRGDYPEALRRYNALIEKNPAEFRPHYLRWILRVDMGDLATLKKELGIDSNQSFEASKDDAMERRPKELRDAGASLRQWMHQIVWRYYLAEPDLIDKAGKPADALACARHTLSHRDLPLDLRHRLEDFRDSLENKLPPLDQAEAIHLDRRYALALTRYNALIAQDPAAFRPRYLRWILLADMGAFSILHEELGLDTALSFDASVEAAVKRIASIFK